MALLRCNCRRGMYLRRCEGDVGAFRLVVFWKMVRAADPLYARRPGSSVAVSPFEPPGAAVGVAMGNSSMVGAPHGTSPASTASLVLFVWVVLFFPLLWLFSITLLLVLEA